MTIENKVEPITYTNKIFIYLNLPFKNIKTVVYKLFPVIGYRMCHIKQSSLTSMVYKCCSQIDRVEYPSVTSRTGNETETCKTSERGQRKN